MKNTNLQTLSFSMTILFGYGEMLS